MAEPMNASPELLAAIEREAREQGVWMVRGDEFKAAGWTMATGEALENYTLAGPRLPLGRVGIVRGSGDWPGPTDRFDVEPITAVLWLLARRSGLTVRVGACTACDGPCPDCDVPGDTSCVMCDGTADLGCAVCSDGERATGIERRPLHEELLAASKWVGVLKRDGCRCDADGCERVASAIRPPAGPGFCEAHNKHTPRARLAVLGDELQAGGDPLGDLLSLWLAGELRAAHVLGVETVPGIPSLRATVHRAEGLARSQLENGAACVDVEQAAGGTWVTASYWDQPTLVARPTAPGR